MDLTDRDNEVPPARPVDGELWELARDAVSDAAARADEYVATGGWTPKVELPSVGVFDSGWPNLSTSRLSQRDGPVDYSALFGPERGLLKPLAYDDAPALRRFVDCARSRADLRSRLRTDYMQDQEFADQLLEMQAVDLPLSIMDRARALGITDSDAIQGLYVQRERAWLADRLPVEYVIPLALTPLDLDQVLPLDGSKRLEPLDVDTQAARAPDLVNSVNSVPTPVLSAATHALVLAGHHLDNPGPIPRLFSRDPENLPLADADLVCEALRVVTHIPVGYAQVLLRPIGWADRWVHHLPSITKVATLRRYPEAFDNFGWREKGPAIPRDALDRVPHILSSLRTAPSKTRLAVKRLSLASLRDDDDDRTVDACIGLEALLSDSRDELAHRLALRAAAALATRTDDPADAKTVYEAVRAIYKHRSAVVHGDRAERYRTFQHGDHRIPTADLARIILRELLLDGLERPGGWTPSALDEILLARLNSNPGELDATAELWVSTSERKFERSSICALPPRS